MKANALALDFDGVAVDHPGGAGHVGQGGCGEQAVNEYTGQAIDGEIKGNVRINPS